MKALLAKTATGNLRSKIIDPKYHTAELVFDVYMSPKEFGELVEKYDEEEFNLKIIDTIAKT